MSHLHNSNQTSILLMILGLLLVLITSFLYDLSSRLHHVELEKFIENLHNIPKVNNENKSSSLFVEDFEIMNMPIAKQTSITSTTTITTTSTTSKTTISSSTTKLTAKTLPSVSTLPEDFPAIIFFKTHKTGSSAVQNILFRLSYYHNLTIGWPNTTESAGSSLWYPHKFQDSFIKNRENSVDILCNHVAYNDELLKFLRTKSGGGKEYTRKIFRFTILREPWSLMKSTFNY